jgi:glyoxylase I family protein
MAMAATSEGPLVRPYGLDHVNLHVRDAAASIQFYEGMLGLTDYEVIDRDEAGNPVFVEFRVGQQLLFLMRRPEYEAPADRKDRGLNHLCLLVEETDPEQLQAQLRARGVPIRGTRLGHNPESFSVYVEDPDGHGIELEQRVTH